MSEITSFSETVTRTDIIPCAQCGSYQVFMNNILSNNKFTSKIYCSDCDNSQYHENNFNSFPPTKQKIDELKDSWIKMWNIANTR